jgi:hypothetical protein
VESNQLTYSAWGKADIFSIRYLFDAVVPFAFKRRQIVGGVADVIPGHGGWNGPIHGLFVLRADSSLRM